jgi:putative NADH-flavin reductase
MKIAILGATGASGRHVVAGALARCWDVSALVRGPADFAEDARLTIVRGDALDVDAVTEAVTGTDAVICLIGAPMRRDPGFVRPNSAKILVPAMETAGVTKLVVVTTVGVAATHAQQSWASRTLLPLIVGREQLDQAGQQEQIIMASGLDWVIVRPPRLVDDATPSAFRLAESLPIAFSANLGRRTLAQALLDLASATTPSRQALTILRQ